MKQLQRQEEQQWAEAKQKKQLEQQAEQGEKMKEQTG